jgi:hypothetical protein
MHLATMLDSDSLLDRSHKAGIDDGDVSEHELELGTKTGVDVATAAVDDAQGPSSLPRNAGRPLMGLSSKASTLGADDEDLQLDGNLTLTLHMSLMVSFSCLCFAV